METELQKALTILKSGGTILYPTDTVWGLGCDATNEVAVEKIFKIKRRSEEKSLVLLLASHMDIYDYSNKVYPAIFEYLENAIKPTTVVYEAAKNLPAKLIHEDGTIAIRIVKDEFCKALIEALGKPLVSTSANISGQPTPLSFKEITTEIKNAVDYIVQQRSKEINKPITASSIIKMNEEGKVLIIRP